MNFEDWGVRFSRGKQNQGAVVLCGISILVLQIEVHTAGWKSITVNFAVHQSSA
jgi:hypothetical protein